MPAPAARTSMLPAMKRPAGPPAIPVSKRPAAAPVSKRPAAAPVRKRPAAASRTAAVVAETSTVANMDEPCIVTEQLVVRMHNTDVGCFGFVNLHGAKITLRDDDEKLVHLTWSPPPPHQAQTCNPC